MSQVSEQPGAVPWPASDEGKVFSGHPDAALASEAGRRIGLRGDSAPWAPLPAMSLYTASPIAVVPDPVPTAPAPNSFGIAAVVVSLFSYLLPVAAIFGIEELDALAEQGAGLRVGLSFFFLLAVAFALAVPVALVAVTLAVVSLKVRGRRRRMGITALVLAGLPLLGALAISIGFLTFVPLPV